MRRLSCALVFALSLGACGSDDAAEGSTESTESSTSSSTTTGAETSGSESSTETSTSGDGDSGDGDSGDGDSGDGDGDSGDGDTGDGDGDSGDGDGDSGDGDGDSGDGDGDSGDGDGDTGDGDGDGDGDAECKIDTDCKLQNDCCGCQGLPQSEDIPICQPLCLIPFCDPLEITEAACVAGTCTIKRLSCDDSTVVCLAPQPVCPDGQSAEVENGCWTNECVPTASCDVVDDCADCRSDEICVQDIAFQTKTRCLPAPAACAGADPDCSCAGDVYCEDPFSICNDTADGLSCACPNC